MSTTRALIAALGLCALAATPFAQAPPVQHPTPVLRGDGPFDRLVFRNIGPASPSGRVDDLAVLESNPAIFYVAGATSGVWKTVNAGTTFTPIFDDQGTASVGDIAIGPTDANLIWVGTGENNNRQSSSWGDGVYKSTDGGRSWKNMGLATSKQIARIIVDPMDFDVVYVAALGDLWAAGGERGVFKTTDGGLTWQRVLFVDDDTGATELVMDPGNNKVLYAATYQRRRAQWGMNGGGAGQRHLEVHRRRRDLAEARERRAAGTEGAHRPRHLACQSERALRAHRASRRKRRLPHRRCRGDVAEDERREPAADVLQPDPHRPADRLAHLRPRRLPAHLGRWRAHLAAERSAEHPRRSSRAVDQPAQPAAPDHRQRRRRQHLPRSLRDLGVDEQPAVRAALPRRLRHAGALPRVHRAAGQQHLVRPQRRAHQQRHPQRQLVRRQRRRRLPAAHGSHRLAHRLWHLAGRADEPHRPDDQRAQDGAAGARRRRHPLPLQLGHGDDAVAARLVHLLCRRQLPLQVHRSRADVVASDQSRPDDQHRPRDVVDHERPGQGDSHRQARRRVHVRQPGDHRRVAGESRHPLDRIRRRGGERVSQRRRGLDQRHREVRRRAQVDLRVQGRRQPVRRGDGLRHVRRSPRRRLRDLRVRHHRPRRDVAVDRRHLAHG